MGRVLGKLKGWKGWQLTQHFQGRHSSRLLEPSREGWPKRYVVELVSTLGLQYPSHSWVTRAHEETRKMPQMLGGPQPLSLNSAQ